MPTLVRRFGDYLICILLILTFPLFFYKLGQSSLVNWDEAWYGEIARNIVKSGDLIKLTWNSTIYTDHPPAGFWIIALSFKLFGVSEFWDRFPSAIFGIGGLIVTFLLGKQLFNRLVGFCSSIALTSAIWYLYRARSGNLDIFLTFFFVLTIYLSLKLSQDRRFFIPLTVSLSLLLLTKTMVPFTIFPVLVLILLTSKLKKLLLISMAIAVLVFGGWVLFEMGIKKAFILRFFSVGLPQVGLQTSVTDNLELIKEYLHSGIGKWFWPSVISVCLGLFLRKKNFFLISLFVFTFFVPFLFSQKGQIWHLIPLYPFMLLSFFGVLDLGLRNLNNLFGSFFKRLAKTKVLVGVVLLLLCAYFTFNQLRQAWFLFIDIPAYISDEAILSKEAGKFSELFFIDGSDFGPTAVFYSQKPVILVGEDGLPKLFGSKEGFVMITQFWRLEKYRILPNQYRIIKSDRDKILIQKV